MKSPRIKDQIIEDIDLSRLEENHFCLESETSMLRINFIDAPDWEYTIEFSSKEWKERGEELGINRTTNGIEMPWVVYDYNHYDFEWLIKCGLQFEIESVVHKPTQKVIDGLTGALKESQKVIEAFIKYSPMDDETKNAQDVLDKIHAAQEHATATLCIIDERLEVKNG